MRAQISGENMKLYQLNPNTFAVWFCMPIDISEVVLGIVWKRGGSTTRDVALMVCSNAHRYGSRDFPETMAWVLINDKKGHCVTRVTNSRPFDIDALT
jgi:hypothetical protein